ncbi:MAG: type II toxin-antitoxin system HicB family antitoxin [Vicinamibacterales bacterium]
MLRDLVIRVARKLNLIRSVVLQVEYEQETDGRWIAEVVELPGVMVYGDTREDACDKLYPLVLRVLADRIENGEWPAKTPHPHHQRGFKLISAHA